MYHQINDCCQATDQYILSYTFNLFIRHLHNPWRQVSASIGCTVIQHVKFYRIDIIPNRLYLWVRIFNKCSQLDTWVISFKNSIKSQLRVFYQSPKAYGLNRKYVFYMCNFHFVF
jgi:hypothetical protein